MVTSPILITSDDKIFLKMKSSGFEKAVTLSKFRGCFLGALLGDCLGAPYENEEKVSKVVLQKDFDKMETSYKALYKQYTDDTAMAKSVAESLIDNGSFNEKDMAKRFVSEYFKEPKRGYGPGVVRVFTKLRNNKLNDVWTPAKEQFDGQGSAGNGAAMRVAPVALFCHDDDEMLVKTVTQTAKLTHTHPLGINGAVLLALAVKQGFNLDPKTSVDVDSFHTQLMNKIKEVEISEESNLFDQDEGSYTNQLEKVVSLLKKKDVSDEEVVASLGNNVLALHSVPTAIYCFLRSQSPIENIKTDNVFRRCLQYSISLGGDTDTIASMAGAISGAHLGEDVIHKCLIEKCESHQYILHLANDLHSVKNSI